MIYQKQISLAVCALAMGWMPHRAAAADAPYKIVATNQVWGTGGIDYVIADNDARRVYVPRGNQILAFDMDTLNQIGSVSNSGGHGAVVDPKTHRGFSTSNPVTMFDSTSLEMLKKIPVQGNPDGLLFEPATEKVYILSHGAPNVTVLDPTKDGAIVGTIDLGGAPEQAASDGMGHVYIDIEDGANIAVVDAKTMTVTGHYSLEDKGSGPAGLGLDAKNHILFAMCRNPAVCVILSADDGKIITTVPLAGSSDSGGFNANTMEAFSSQGNGTLSIIKENSPTSFEAEPTVQTIAGGKCSTLDTKLNRILVTAIDRTSPPPASAGNAPAPAAPPANPGRRGGRGGGPGYLDLIAVGR